MEFKQELEKFDPTVATLKEIAKKAAGVDLTDVHSKEELKVVHDTRIELRDHRVAITKKGKEMREDAKKFQDAVIAKERELIAIIQPEEERLKVLEEEAKAAVETERRKAALPEKKERLDAIGDNFTLTDEELLEFDEVSFESYYNQRVASHNEKLRLAAEEEVRKLEAEKLAAEEEARKREEEAERLRREEKDKEAAALKEKEEALQKEKDALVAEKHRLEVEETARKEAEKARIKVEEAAEQRQKEIKEAKEAKEAAEKLSTEYQNWLNEIGYVESDSYRIERQGSKSVVYKRLAIFEWNK